jgi:hypothetical protein
MKLVEEDLIDTVEALSGREVRGDGTVNLLLRQSLEGESGLADDRKRPHLRRIIALVGSSDEIRARAECVGDLSGGGKEGDYARHDTNL